MKVLRQSKKYKTILTAMLLALVILLADFLGLTSPITAKAADDGLDVNRTGSVVITIKDKNGPVGGGSLILYQVGALKLNGNSYDYELTKDFEASRIPLIEIASERLAVDIGQYILDHKIEGRSMPVDPEGVAKAYGLETGLYFVMQDEAAEGYEAIKSFVVSIPMQEDGEWIYDVNATPKVQTKTEDGPPKEPPKNPPKLPQTGQLWWPVPILAFVGILCFSIGWYRRKHS